LRQSGHSTRRHIVSTSEEKTMAKGKKAKKGKKGK